MAKACQELVNDIGPKGMSGGSSDGSSPFERMNRYGTWGGSAAESTVYSAKTAIEIVMQLFVDDGVPDRSHRENLFSK